MTFNNRISKVFGTRSPKETILVDLGKILITNMINRQVDIFPVICSAFFCCQSFLSLFSLMPFSSICLIPCFFPKFTIFLITFIISTGLTLLAFRTRQFLPGSQELATEMQVSRHPHSHFPSLHV